MFYLSILVCLLRAQSTNAYLQGEVVAGNDGAVPAHLTVEVYDASSHMVVERTPVSPTGAFVLHNAPKGGTGFDLRVVDRRGDVLRQERVSASQPPSGLTIRVNGEKQARPSGEVISVKRLRHKPPKKARKEYELAEKALKKGDPEGSLRHLQAAVEVDPEFLEAYNNMGTRLLNLGRPGPAAEAFRKAADLNPVESKPYTNLAIALLHLNQPAEAERAARHSLGLHRESRHAEYVLGLSLATQKKDVPEALALLRRAAVEWPHAGLVAASLLMRQGNLGEARLELGQVVERGAAQHQALARQWLAAIEESRASRK
ncbi:MAG: tetratricopeptide repeat protein [Bryobacteraceae bacterium]|nr:tetratricopeptide repeat protein [Bryobacteraceae bacterium]